MLTTVEYLSLLRAYQHFANMRGTDQEYTAVFFPTCKM